MFGADGVSNDGDDQQLKDLRNLVKGTQQQ